MDGDGQLESTWWRTWSFRKIQGCGRGEREKESVGRGEVGRRKGKTKPDKEQVPANASWCLVLMASCIFACAKSHHHGVVNE